MRPFLLSLFAVTALHAADPLPPNEARLRDALRAVTLQLQTAEAERASLQAAQTALEQKNRTLTEQTASLGKQLADEKDAAKKTRTELQGQLDQQKAEIAGLNESLGKWKEGFEKAAALARKTEAERVKAAASAAALQNRVADLERKNLALFNLGSEILQRYEGFGLGTALAAREPFIGTARVRLENQVQGYKDRLLDPKLKP